MHSNRRFFSAFWNVKHPNTHHTHTGTRAHTHTRTHPRTYTCMHPPSSRVKGLVGGVVSQEMNPLTTLHNALPSNPLVRLGPSITSVWPFLQPPHLEADRSFRHSFPRLWNCLPINFWCFPQSALPPTIVVGVPLSHSSSSLPFNSFVQYLSP